MHTAVVVVSLVALLPLRPAALHARWLSPQDSRSVAELATMAMNDLFNEAFDVCVRRAMLEKDVGRGDARIGATITEASRYLDAIAAIVTERQGGQTPGWMTEMAAAHTAKTCQQAFRRFLAGAPAAAATPARRKATAARRRDPQEQLPPWLAPPAQ
jgi:hypothetical protein